MKDKPLFDTHVRMKEIRKNLGLTARATADYMGVAYAKFAKIENGQQHIRLEEIIAFRDLCSERGLVVDINALITGENYQPILPGKWSRSKVKV